eukprot:gene3200-5516_t
MQNFFILLCIVVHAYDISRGVFEKEQLGNEKTSFPQELITESSLPYSELKEIPTFSFVDKQFAAVVDNNLTTEKEETSGKLCKTKYLNGKKKALSTQKITDDVLMTTKKKPDETLRVKNNSPIRTNSESILPTFSFEEKIPFTGIQKFSIDEVLHKLHIIRFACEFDDLDSLDDIGNIQFQPGFSVHSLDKKMMTVRLELENILSSKHSIYGMYTVSKIGLFDSIFCVPEELQIDVDLMDCIKNLKSESTIQQFLQKFSKVEILKKVRRKYRKVDLRGEFLSQLFFSKKERKYIKE